MAAGAEPLLAVDGLRVAFAGPKAAATTAVRQLDFTVMPGEAVALVGESGCGKSTTALAVMGLLPRTAKTAGAVRLNGVDLLSLGEAEMRRLRGNAMGMIFQEPMTSLNPVHRIGDQIVEALLSHRSMSYRAARSRALDLLDMVRIPDPSRRIDEYPHRLSGGQRQRVMIAAAIACEPKLLIADEPTTALDATIQAQILQLLDELRRKLSMGLLLITHDLSLVSRWTDRVVVMHHGEKMEELGARDLFSHGSHPYTRGLISASIRRDDMRHYRADRLTEIRAGQDVSGEYRFRLHKPARIDFGRQQPSADEKQLSVRNLVTEYRTAKGGAFRAVDDVSFDVAAGETVGLVGESGSGKSTLSKSVMRLVPVRSGQIRFRGEDITHAAGERLRAARRNMQMIFQDPFASLNPRQTVSDILESVLSVHSVTDRHERRRRIVEMLDRVGLASHALARYPHEFSGGQRQRIGIARALILKPSLVVCDEPVSALDVSVQAQILNLLVELKHSLNLSYLFISHDLGVVQYVSDRVLVMKDARIVEESDHRQIWENPRHPYTRTLIAAVAPRFADGGDLPRMAIAGAAS